MSDRTPFYKRTLDSFADHIITRARPRDDGSWHAVLDCGFRSHVSDPDFSPYGYGQSREEASARSAAAIRADARGIGKFAPHSLLVPGYDLHWRLMKHWEMKERFEAVGLDPNEMYFSADDSANNSKWELNGHHLAVWTEQRLLEFTFRLHMAEVSAEIQAGDLGHDAARDEIVKRVKGDMEDGRHLSRPTDATWLHMDRQIDEYLAANSLLPVPSP